MKFCTKCHKQYEDSTNFCFDDGSSLVVGPVEISNLEAFPVYFQQNQIRLDTTVRPFSHDYPTALGIKFHLAPIPGLSDASIKAIVEISSDREESIYFKDEGMWLHNATAYEHLTVGGFATLIVGLYKDGRFYPCERAYLDYDRERFRGFYGSEATITVQIAERATRAAGFVQSFNLRLSLEPKFYFEIVSANSADTLRLRKEFP
jgi:hypothetical protein